MYISILIGILVYIYVLNKLKKNNMSAFYFMVGSVGFLCITMLLTYEYLAVIISKLILTIMGWLSGLISIYDVYIDYNIIFINNAKASISLYMDYECCGLIEILALSSIILFHPLFDIKKKIVRLIIGFVWTCFANIMRLLSICLIIYNYGNDSYYIAHSVVGRIVFYAFTIALYYYMFSFGQIKRQRLGRFNYTKEEE